MRIAILFLSAVMVATAAAIPQDSRQVEKHSLKRSTKESSDKKSEAAKRVTTDSAEERSSVTADALFLEKLRQIYGSSELEIAKTENMNVGDAASGVVIRRSSETITVDTTPCSDRKQLATFHKEYAESKISDITCPGGNKYSRTKVRQR